jgi:hypothetical protein
MENLRLSSYSRTLQQQWTYPGGGIGMYDINQLLTSVGISTAGLKMTTNILSFLKFWAWDSTPVVVGVSHKWGQNHVVLCKRVYTDGTCVFLDPAQEIGGVISIPGDKLPDYFPSWDSQYANPDGTIDNVLLPTQLS